MTRSERFVKDRLWLKTEYFAVTNSLRSILENSNLPEEEQQKLAYIQNKVLITRHDFDEEWVQIPRKYLSGKCGNHYRKYIDILIGWNQLERSHSYCATDDENAYPKSCLVPKTALLNGVCNLNFRKKRLRPPIPENNPQDEVSQYALHCLSKLTVVKDGEFYLPNDPIHSSLIKDHCEHIAFKDFSLGYGTESKRLFHRVIMMPSEGRCNLRLPCFGLVEYDVKSCHPLLLYNLFTDGVERQKYRSLLENDIYSTIGKVNGSLDRELVKVDFLKAVNAKRKNLQWLGSNYVFNYFQDNFPNFTQSVLLQRSDLAIYLQNLEAELMVQELGSYCQTEGLYWFPQHDGWITIPSDEENINRQATKIIADKIGLTPTLTRNTIWDWGNNNN